MLNFLQVPKKGKKMQIVLLRCSHSQAKMNNIYFIHFKIFVIIWVLWCFQNKIICLMLKKRTINTNTKNKNLMTGYTLYTIHLYINNIFLKLDLPYSKPTKNTGQLHILNITLLSLLQSLHHPMKVQNKGNIVWNKY